jgi:hypothetical protein
MPAVADRGGVRIGEAGARFDRLQVKASHLENPFNST